MEKQADDQVGLCNTSLTVGDNIEADLSAAALDKLDYVRFTVADIHGISRYKTVVRKHFSRFFTEGVEFNDADVASIWTSSESTSLNQVRQVFASGAVQARPMSGTLHRLPWATSGNVDSRIGEILCETVIQRAGARAGAGQCSPLQTCSRLAARKQLQRLDALGFTLKSGFEAEFTVFKANSLEPLFNDNAVYANYNLSQVEAFMYSLDEQLMVAGVDSQCLQTESGRGQLEFALAPSNGITPADDMFLFRQGVKDAAARQGLHVSFMAKPTQLCSGTGLHFNHSLWSVHNEPCNVLHDQTAVDGLSDVCRRWLAGLIHHGSSLTALCCPTINCYRRLNRRPVPSFSNWGLDDRTTAFRVISRGSSSTFVENRIPSSAANPYLVLAATVAAGIDGLTNDQLQCPTASDHQITDTGLGLVTVANGLPSLPPDLPDALDQLEKDKVLVEALGTELVDLFVTVKRNVELEKIKAIQDDTQLFAVERELYFNY